MRFSPAIAARLTTLVLVSAGAGLYAAVGAVAKPDPAAPYLGMSVTDILACAGEPHSRFESGPNKETLVFRYTGAGPVPAEKSKADDKKSGDKKSADKKSATKSTTRNRTTSRPTTSSPTSKKSATSVRRQEIRQLTSSPPSSAKTARRRRTRTGPARRASCSKTASSSRVTFAHKDVHSPYDWQAEKDPVKQEEKRKEGVPTCEFSLPRCVRQ